MTVVAYAWMMTADAAVRGRLNGQRFVSAYALATTDPIRPWNVWVILSAEPLQCSGALPWRVSPATVLFRFSSSTPGVGVSEIVGVEDEVRGDATLTRAPHATGDRGTAEISLQGGASRLIGSIEFTLCETVVPKPLVSLDELAPATLTLASNPHDSASFVELGADVPAGWTVIEHVPLGSAVEWQAPDGVTTLTITLMDEISASEAAVAAWADLHLPRSGGPGVPWAGGEQVTVRSRQMLDPSTCALQWAHRPHANGAWIEVMDIFRSNAMLPAVHCTLTTDLSGVELSTAASRVCGSVDVVRP
jgi:hypothetical protein